MRCKGKKCKKPATSGKFCRLHYIAQWAKKREHQSQAKERILDRYIAAISKKYPDTYLEVIKRDLSSEKRFRETLEELDISDFSDKDLKVEFQEILDKVKKED